MPDPLDRRHAALDRPGDNRLGAQRDRDRLLYSSALRRLAGVTQVVASNEGHVFHNRLTHTLKVAQVARRLAEKLARPWSQDDPPSEPPPAIDPDVVETAALAHDLGHPPFGHVAEKRLHTLMRGVAPPFPPSEAKKPVYDPFDGFEGNAQSFRIITRLARIDLAFQGLNLTRASLAATLKYPWFHDSTNTDAKAFRKWGAYSSETDDYRYALDLGTGVLPPTEPPDPTIEAQIMDWADDITYAVHDAEDLYRAGLVPLDRLAGQASERQAFAEWVHRRWKGLWNGQPIAVETIAESTLVVATFFGSRSPYDGSTEQRIAVRSFVSSLVGRYVGETRLEFTDGGHQLTILDDYRLEVDVLKELSWRYVIERPSLASQQEGQLVIIADLFSTLIDAMEGRRNRALLPQRAIEALESMEESPRTRGRIACDVICSLTEQEATRLHRRLAGVDIGSIIDPLLPT